MSIKPIILAALVGLALSASAFASDAEAFFKTPKGAVYCVYEGSIYCWTPNDGFTVQMTWTGKPTKTYYQANRGRMPSGYPTVRFGHYYRQGAIRCDSRRNGLTCVNGRGHGWWLGRYVGYRLF